MPKVILRQWCDICSAERATYFNVVADNCYSTCKKHNLCSMCYELGHVRPELEKPPTLDNLWNHK